MVAKFEWERECSDGYERRKLEEFLLDLTGSEYCPGAGSFEGQCTTAIHKSPQIS
jgi:hypothetical protein